ncbi:synaptonemal complex central element protein 3 [Myripristis murdjan]|uniref:synaptonemal complex central element protein 3 n=1 Tax=Myripristis murdjan TaxID=586833 RepID=UPI0011763AEA|nr:synaptonemal complex central element protein 3 [Myripristis murdjan]
MTDSPSPTELQQNSDEDMLELNKELERMIEDAENISVQLAWMAYDMVVLRVSPGLQDSMQKLQDAYLRCRLTVFGEHGQEQEMDRCPDPAPCPDPTPKTDM